MKQTQTKILVPRYLTQMSCFIGFLLSWSTYIRKSFSESVLSPLFDCLQHFMSQVVFKNLNTESEPDLFYVMLLVTLSLEIWVSCPHRKARIKYRDYLVRFLTFSSHLFIPPYISSVCSWCCQCCSLSLHLLTFSSILTQFSVFTFSIRINSKYLLRDISYSWFVPVLFITCVESPPIKWDASSHKCILF